MAQTGLFQPTDIQDVTLEVYVNGFLRRHHTVDFAGDTSGGLPDQVVSVGTGMVSRTGSITWSPTDAMMEDPPHPVRRTSGWPPREGDTVEINAIIDGVAFRRFTGRIGKTTGSLAGGTLQSEITDVLADHLSQLVNIPPRLTGASGQSYRVAWEALEQAGLGLLPQPDEGAGTTILHSTPQGDSWATIGSVASTSGATSTRDLSAGLTLWTGLTTQTVDESRLGNSILLIARGSTTQDSSVSVRLSDGTVLRLNHQYATGDMQMYVGSTQVGTARWAEPGVPALAFGVSFGWIHLWTSRRTKVEIPTDSLPWKAQEVWGTRIAGAQVRYVADLDDVADVLTAIPLRPAALRLPIISYSRLPATRGFENVAARTVVDGWGESVLASVWQDEFGQTEVCSRAAMLARPVSRTVRVSERVFSGSWAIGEDSVYSSVVVVGEQGVVRKSSIAQPRIDVYQEQSTRVMSESTTEERFIEAEPEVDWGTVDTEARHAHDGPGAGEMPGDGPGRGTWIHAVTLSADAETPGGEWWIWYPGFPGGNYTIQIERLGHRTLKITEAVTVPSGRVAYLKSPALDTTTRLRPAYRDLPSPIIRADWTSTWARYSRKASAGASQFPVLEHDVGWWLTPTDAQKLANSLAAEVSTPMATLSQIATLWDPTRQVGDIEQWVAQDSNGNDCWTAKVLVTGYRENWDGDVPSMSVDVRVVSMSDIEVEPPFIPMWGYASHTLADPSAIIPSVWGRSLVVLVEPLGMAASPWGTAAVTLTEPHWPVVVWDGTKMNYTVIDVRVEDPEP